MITLTPSRLALLRLAVLPFTIDEERVRGGTSLEDLLVYLIEHASEAEHFDFSTLAVLTEDLDAGHGQGQTDRWVEWAGLKGRLDLHSLYGLQSTIDQLMAADTQRLKGGAALPLRLEAEGVILVYLRQSYLALETMTFDQASSLVADYNRWAGLGVSETLPGFLGKLHAELRTPVRSESPRSPQPSGQTDFRSDYDYRAKDDDPHQLLLSLALDHAQMDEYASARYTIDEVVKLARERADPISLTHALILERQLDRWKSSKEGPDSGHHYNDQKATTNTTLSTGTRSDWGPTTILQTTLLLLDVDQSLQEGHLDISTCLPKLIRAKAILDDDDIKGHSIGDEEIAAKRHLAFQIQVLESTWWALMGFDGIASTCLDQTLDLKLSPDDTILRACHQAVKVSESGRYDDALKVILHPAQLPKRGLDQITWKSWVSTIISVLARKQLGLGHPRLADQLLDCLVLDRKEGFNVHLVLLQADAYLALGQPHRAESVLLGFLDHSSYSIDGKLGLVQYHLHQREWSKALKEVLECLESSRKTHRWAHHLHARVYCAEASLELGLHRKAYNLLHPVFHLLLSLENPAVLGYSRSVFARCRLAILMEEPKAAERAAVLGQIRSLFESATQDFASACNKTLLHETRQRLTHLEEGDLDSACFGQCKPQECDEMGVQAYSIAKEQPRSWSPTR